MIPVEPVAITRTTNTPSSVYWWDSSVNAGSTIEPSPQSMLTETGPSGSSVLVVIVSSPARLRCMRP